MRPRAPSVTQILRELGLTPDYGRWGEADSLKRRLGTDVHSLCAGRKVPPGPAHDYARQFLLWFGKSRAKLIRSEFAVRSPAWRGRADLEIEWAGERWVLDIKTGVHEQWHRLQLAAYSLGMYGEPANRRNRMYQTRPRRGVLLLSPGAARMIPFEDDSDYEAWFDCVRLWHWRRRAGLLPERTERD